MINKKIVFVSMDEDYISSVEYKLVEIIGKNAEIEFITDIEYFRFFTSVPKKIDVLIMPYAMRGDGINKLNVGKIFYLTEEQLQAENDMENQIIYKYGSVRYLVEKLDINLLVEKEKCGKEGTKTISVYSVNGGCGKTLTALSIAYNLYKKGNRVLYVSTEYMQDFEFYLNSNEKLSEEFVYQCSMNIKNALKILTKEIKTCGFDYIPPFRKIPITYQIDFDIYYDFVNYMKNKNAYDYIVVELSEELSSKKVAFMQECERNLMVTSQGQVAVNKLESFLDNTAGFEEKLIILCNRCVDNKQNYLEISPLATKCEICEYVDEYAIELTFEDIKKYDLFSKTTLCLE